MNRAYLFEHLIQQLAEQYRLDLRGYKLSTLQRRIRGRMEQLRIATFEEYEGFVRDHPAEVNELLNTILINVTKFFRDPVAWEWMRTEGIPLLWSNHRTGEGFKVWCAGCSTGEEAYSIAILLAQHLGEAVFHHDIKIYATDQDEHALAVARRAEYDRQSLKHLLPEVRDRFFSGKDQMMRFDRELRRLVIFGRSNLITDAPISHADLVICRNVLIYFDPSAQRHVMNRLQYSVKPGGILFLGKSESPLQDSPYFTALNARWRIFQRTTKPSTLERQRVMTTGNLEQGWDEKSQQELRLLKVYHNAILETLEPGIVLVDNDDRVIGENEAMRRLWQIETRLLGSRLPDSALAEKCPELPEAVNQARERNTAIQMECAVGADRHLSLTVRPVSEEGKKEIIGLLIYAEDISPEQNLQTSVEELQTTAEELQSTNEELETTNEELQSTNEELETTNEELQSTNEELETTNEELKSLNEELEDINEELAKRSKELDELNARHSEMVERMPWPMLLADRDGAISLYNSAAQAMFGFATPSDQGMSLEQLPVTKANRQRLVDKFRQAVSRGKPITLEGLHMVTNAGSFMVNLQISPLSQADSQHGMLVVFERAGSPGKTVPGPKRNMMGALKAANETWLRPGRRGGTEVNGDKSPAKKAKPKARKAKPRTGKTKR